MSKSWIIVIVLVAAVAALIGWKSVQPDATLEALHAERRDIRAFVEEQAVTELPHDTLISMPISGWLEPIRLREGDAVTKDQIVARLETADLQDRVAQAQQRIAILDSQIEETADHRLEQNALVNVEATVKALDETVKAAEAKLDATRAVMDYTKTELDRIMQLSERGSASDRELREAEMEHRKAKAEYQSDTLDLAALRTIAAVSYIGPKFINDYIDRKKFTLDQHRNELVEARKQLAIEERNLARAEIRSPIDGVVLLRHQTRRQFLEAGRPLLTIGSLDDMEVVAEVLTQRATGLSSGDPVEIFGQALPDGPIAGRVSRVYPAGFEKISLLGVEQRRVNVAVTMNRRPPQLGVGFRVSVRIFYDESANALTVPRNCLFRGPDGGWHVMVVEAGHVQLKAVTVGITNDDLAEITEGISPDDAIVARPSREIEPGMRVDVHLVPAGPVGGAAG